MIYDNDKGYGGKGGSQPYDSVECVTWTDGEDVVGHIKKGAAGDRGVQLCFEHGGKAFGELWLQTNWCHRDL